MSLVQINETATEPLRRHRALTGIIEQLMRRCELSPEAQERVRRHYKEKTEQLQGCPWLQQFDLQLGPQGSVALGTSVAPIARKHGEHDIDLVLRVQAPKDLFDPRTLHRRIGERLRADYADVLSPIRFGWTLDYAIKERFHFDVVAAIPWLHDTGGPMAAAANKDTNAWQPTNPGGYAQRFLALAAILPVIADQEYQDLLEGRMVCNSRSVTVETLPEDTLLKFPLQRGTQFTKRFRDVWFSRRNRLKQRTPSIIVTTMLWLAYERYVVGKTFSSMFAVLETMAHHLDDPAFLRIREFQSGLRSYTLWNPTVPDENLVARWNHPDRQGEAEEYFAWVKEFRAFLRSLAGADGIHRLEPLLVESIGGVETPEVLREIAAAMRPSPTRAPVFHHHRVGLTTAAVAGATAVRAHTYDGKR